MAEIVQIMDFAADEVVIEFNVGEDHFVAVPDIPLGMMQKVVQMRNLQKTLAETGDLSAIFDVFDELLTPESATLFKHCVEVKKTIGLRRIMNILPWLMEKYGLGPTQQSSPSSNGSSDDETGSSSEDGASPTVSVMSLDSGLSTVST
jgi:hypothetical protein